MTVSAYYAVLRARRAVGELNASRTSDDIERVRKGVEHELETALKLLGAPWEWHVAQKDRTTAEPTADTPPDQPDLWS